MVKAIFSIHKKLVECQGNVVSLRDIERLRKLYRWLKLNLPSVANININQTIERHYQNINLRSVFLTISFTFLVRLDTETKRN